MKKILFFTILSFLSSSLFAQEDTVPSIKKFEDVSTNLYISKVIDLPNKNQKELNQQFKNWASTAFVNLKEVLVSETENQIVLVYIVEPNFWGKSLGMKIFYPYKHYVRMVGQFKDNKCKISMFDDGNVFKYGEYIGNYKSPDKLARTLYLGNITNVIIKPELNDYHKIKNYTYGAICDWENKVETTLSSYENALKNNSSYAKLKEDF